jgi:KDO2-lipid IV(A) lauroyltransferase
MSQLSAPATVWEAVLTERRFSTMERRSMELRWQHEESLPVQHINIFGSLKEAFKCLKKNEILGVAVDGGGGKDRLAIDFLTTRALFSPGPMDIAVRTNCKVLPTFMIRDHHGKNTLVIEPPITVETGERETTIENMLTAFVLRLEEYVKNYPDHYLNFLVLRRRMTTPGERPFLLD